MTESEKLGEAVNKLIDHLVTVEDDRGLELTRDVQLTLGRVLDELREGEPVKILAVITSAGNA